MAWDSSLRFSNKIPNVDLGAISSVDPSRNGSPGESTASKETVPEYVDYSEKPLSQQQPRESRRTYTGLSLRTTLSSTWCSLRDYGVSHFNVPRLAAPWEHEVSKKSTLPPSHTIREFHPGRQRRRLWTNSAFQFGITLGLCGLLTGTLAGYGAVEAMSLGQKHCFNALITLWSIMLGLNLAASLRGYAQMLRWRFLASKYRSLQEFELVMQCDSQTKVFRLLWTAHTKGRLWLNKTQILCILSLSVNVLMQILVTLLGFTYNIEDSNFLNQIWGQVSICNLTTIQDVNSRSYSQGAPVSFHQQLAFANEYGIMGSDYGLQVASSYSQEIDNQVVYTNPDYTVMFYRFQDQEPDNSANSIVTDRTISCTATCEEYTLLSAANGTDTITTYLDHHTNKQVTIDMQTVSPGVTTYSSKMNSDCGPRCTQLRILQSTDNYYVPKPRFYLCNNTVAHVTNVPEYAYPAYGTPASDYTMPDGPAAAIAGAIGWSGFYYDNNDWQALMYSAPSFWSPDWPIDTTNLMAQRVMDFAMGAVAALDVEGPRATVRGFTPVQAELVAVQWRWAATVLALVPTIQLIALLCVVAWGGKVVIKDTGVLSLARLMRPVVERLGPRGCLLTTDEICEALGNVRVKYGWREPGAVRGMDQYDGFGGDGGDGFGLGGLRPGREAEVGMMDRAPDDVVRHVDVLEESEGLELGTSFPKGRYDGLYSRDRGEWVAGEGIRRRARARRNSL